MRGTKQCNRWLRRVALLASTSAALAAPGVASAATVTNGGFETGDFTGWTVHNQVGGSGDWFNYTGSSSPVNGFTISAPPEGGRAATTDQPGPGTHILYQDVFLPAGETHTFSASIYHENQNGAFHSPATLDWTVAPNQQYRVDVMKPAAAVDSVAAADVLVNVFQTMPGDAPSRPPGTVTADLTPFAGLTVRLRFAEADNQFYFQASVDDVKVTSASAGPTCNGLSPSPGYNFAGDNTPRTISGTSGDDVIYAGGGNDSIDGSGGNDTICGVSGDDKVRGGTGDDFVFGGPGSDDLGGQAGADEVVGGQGNDRVNGAEGNDQVRGGDGDDIANGGDGDDSVHGGANDDVLAGNAGIDECVGNAGNDRATTNGGCETINSADVSNNTAAPAGADAKVVASANDPDEANGNAATLMPKTDAGSGMDVAGGNSTAFGDGV